MARRPRTPQQVQTRFKPNRRPIFLRQWRKYRNLTQEQVADYMGWSVSNVSQLERGQQGYSDDGLAALAELLRCTPGQLLDVDPTNDDSIWSLWERAEPGQRTILLEVAKNFLKTGTDN
jgi:transcriptional regulator with XRE-family HTH domain